MPAQDNSEKKIILSNDKYEREGAQLHPIDVEFLKSATQPSAGLIQINSIEELQKLAEQATEQYDEFIATAIKIVTPRRARYVYELRESHKYTWRMIAAACFSQWKEANWSPPYNQLAGMAICKIAASVLKKNFD